MEDVSESLESIDTKTIYDKSEERFVCGPCFYVNYSTSLPASTPSPQQAVYHSENIPSDLSMDAPVQPLLSCYPKRCTSGPLAKTKHYQYIMHVK